MMNYKGTGETGNSLLDVYKKSLAEYSDAL